VMANFDSGGIFDYRYQRTGTYHFLGIRV